MFLAKFPPATVLWVYDKMMNDMNRKPGFPDTDRLISSYATSMLRIAHPALVVLQMTTKKFDLFPDDPDVVEALNCPVEALEVMTVTHSANKKIGAVWPIDWLISHSNDHFDRFFPSPVALRRAWTEHFPPADGEEAAEAED